MMRITELYGCKGYMGFAQHSGSPSTREGEICLGAFIDEYRFDLSVGVRVGEYIVLEFKIELCWF